MITAKNITTAKIDFSKLPAKFKNDFADIKEMAPYHGQDADITEAIDKYVAGLNAELGKAKPKPKPAPKKKTAAKKPTESDLSNKLRKLQRELNSERLRTYTDGDSSPEEKARRLEREQKLKEFKAVQNQLSTYKKTAAKKTTTKRTQSKSEAAKAKKAYEADKAKAIAGKFAGLSRNEVLAIAQRVHRNRRLSAQIVDEGADHKKRLSPTPENLVRWMKEPGKFDLIGVDTFKKNDPTADLKIRKEIFWNRLLKK